MATTFTSREHKLSEQQMATLMELGNVWQKNGHHRIYLNDLPSLYGLKVSYYGTGNVRSATLDGEKISNAAATRLLGPLSGKMWYDVVTTQFATDGSDRDVFVSLLTEIRNRLGLS